MDLTKGPIFKKLILFTFPIMISYLLQQLYHAADVVIVGNFAQNSKISLAAVGSTGSMTTLLLNLFIGLSTGANVVCANLYGAGKKEELDKAMPTALLTALGSGIVVAVIGFVFTKPMLRLMGSPDTVIDRAVVYGRIIFLGQPATLIYNFGAGILRAYGDTKRTMYILGFTGLANVILNIIFVVVFHMDEAGVALATIIASYLSAILVLILLFHPKSEQQLRFSALSFHKEYFRKIVKIGLPSGLNGVAFSLSNVLIGAAINSLGDVAVAANSTAGSLEGVIYQILTAFSSACMSFAGQNFGAGKLKRIDKLLGVAILSCFSGLVMSVLTVNLFPEFFLHLFTDDKEVVRMGIYSLRIVCGFYPLYTLTDLPIGCMRGMRRTLLPSLLNVACICGVRFFWILFIFPMNRQLYFMYLCYPLSWIFSSVTQLICYYCVRKQEENRLALRNESEEAIPA